MHSCAGNLRRTNQDGRRCVDVARLVSDLRSFWREITVRQKSYWVDGRTASLVRSECARLVGVVCVTTLGVPNDSQYEWRIERIDWQKKHISQA